MSLYDINLAIGDKALHVSRNPYESAILASSETSHIPYERSIIIFGI